MYILWHTIIYSTENVVKMSQDFFEKVEKKKTENIFFFERKSENKRTKLGNGTI